MEKRQRLIAGTEMYLEDSWSAVDLLANGENVNPLFALQRAYYALYNTAIAGAILLGIDLRRYQGDSTFHVEKGEILHTYLPMLVSDIVNLIEPPVKLGSRQSSSRATEAFSLAQLLRKARLSADYMGTLTITREELRPQIEMSKTLVATLWRYCCDNC